MTSVRIAHESGSSRRRVVKALIAALGSAILAAGGDAPAAGAAPSVQPLVIGESFTLHSGILHETRRINIYRPPGFSADSAQPLAVLYMPDGGMAEDFLHIAGLIQIGVSNGTMRPWLLVGIENTERRRDLTGPTDNADDRKIAPRVGGSQAFRDFLRKELMPQIRRRYRTTEEKAIVGESLAGLFVMDTLAVEPDLFTIYIAIDPSLWWNDSTILKKPAGWLQGPEYAGKALFIAWSSDAEPGTAAWAQQLQSSLAGANGPAAHVLFQPFPGERHATIYHPAALQAFRAMLKAAP